MSFIINVIFFIWNWSNAINIWSALCVLKAWWFNTRASVATVLRMHPYISSCLWVKCLSCIYVGLNLVITVSADAPAPKGAGPSADTVMTRCNCTFSSKFLDFFYQTILFKISHELRQQFQSPSFPVLVPGRWLYAKEMYYNNIISFWTTYVILHRNTIHIHEEIIYC